jgi:hypothetical protein
MMEVKFHHAAKSVFGRGGECLEIKTVVCHWFFKEIFSLRPDPRICLTLGFVQTKTALLRFL